MRASIARVTLDCMNKRNLIDGALDYDDGLGSRTSSAALDRTRQVVWRRQARAYHRLRDVIDAHYLRTPRVRDGVAVCLELPHRLYGWRPCHGNEVRELYPEMGDIVGKIGRLVTERTAMRADRTFIPKSVEYKRAPLPKAPAAREAERTRRAVESMRALRERRRMERLDEKNRDLIE